VISPKGAEIETGKRARNRHRNREPGNLRVHSGDDIITPCAVQRLGFSAAVHCLQFGRAVHSLKFRRAAHCLQFPGPAGSGHLV